MVMGLVANYPIALAPGMGLNTYFTFSVCMGMGVPWQTALAAVFVSGVVFLFVSLFKFREAMINAIPMSLKLAIAGGIGLFLALIALKSSGVVIANEPTLIKMGDLSSASVLFAALGFLLIVVMHHFKVRGAIIISILAITMLSTLTGHNEFKGVFGEIPSLAPTFMQMDFEGLFTASMIGVIFVFFLVDLFDSTGTLVGVSQRAGLLVDGKLPRLKRALMADSSAIIAGAALGTSSTTQL
jgi:AGZA family xanthine/uracil permease-like MFS transporter